MRHFLYLTCFLITSSSLFAQAPLRPGDVSAEHLKPFEAHYQQVVQGQNAGRRIHHLQEAVFPNGPGFRYVISMLGLDTVYDEIRFLASGFEPVSRHVSARTRVQSVEVWQDNQLRGVRTEGDGANPRPFERSVDGVRFPGALELVLSALDLTSESQTLASFSSDFGLENAEITVQVKELRREKLKLAGQEWSVRVAESRILSRDGQPLLPAAMHLWVASEPPYLVKMEMGPMVLELAAVR